VGDLSFYGQGGKAEFGQTSAIERSVIIFLTKSEKKIFSFFPAGLYVLTPYYFWYSG